MAKKQQMEQQDKTVSEVVDECKQISDKCDMVIAKLKTKKNQNDR